MLSQMVRFHSFLWPNYIPLYVCTITFLSTHILMGTWVASVSCLSPFLNWIISFCAIELQEFLFYFGVLPLIRYMIQKYFHPIFYTFYRRKRQYRQYKSLGWNYTTTGYVSEVNFLPPSLPLFLLFYFLKSQLTVSFVVICFFFQMVKRNTPILLSSIMFFLLGLYPKNPEHQFKRTYEPQCSQWYYLQQPSAGNSLSNHEQMSGSKNCGTFT